MASDSNGPAFNIVSVSGGTVVERTATGLLDKDASQDKTQHWTLEYDGDSDTKVAFQNAANGEYLNCSNGAAYGKIDTSSSKQWWTLEKGRAPGSCWIKCNDWPDAYLCNANGSYVTGNTIYAWPKQANWTHALTWYLRDANAEGFKPTGYSVSAEGNSDQQADELRKREEALSKKEQDLAAQEVMQKTHLEQIATKEKELRELAVKQQEALKSEESSLEAKKLADLQANLQRKLDETRSKERELASRETAASKKEKQAYETAEKLKKQTSAKEAELQKKEQELVQREKVVADAKARAFSDGEDSARLKAQNQDLHQRLRELQTQLDTATARASSAGSDSVSNQEATRAKDENIRLKDLIAQLALQLNDSQKARRPRKLASVSSTNSETTTAFKSTLAASTPAKASKPIAQSPIIKPDGSMLAVMKAENGHLAEELDILKKQASTSVEQAQAEAKDPALTAAFKAENARLIEELMRLKQSTSVSKSQTNGFATTKPTLANSSQKSSTAGATTLDAATKPSSVTSNGVTRTRPNDANVSKGRQPSTSSTLIGDKQTSSQGPRPGVTTQTSNGGPKQQSARPTPATAKISTEVDKLKVEQARLKQQIEQLKTASVTRVQVGSHTGAHIHGSGPKVEAVDEHQIVYDCGHVLHPLPRKIDKRVVGILYER